MSEDYIEIRFSRKDLEIIKEALKNYTPPKKQDIKKEIIEERNKLKEFLNK